jgi:hypothetical protein
MGDWSPTGAPFSISERASASAQLERAYRRLVGLYPRSFRRESTEEIIAVLLATAREDQRRPSLMETADLLRGALRMRLGLSGCPRTVLYAVRLMYLGALAQLGVLVILLVNYGGIEAAARAAAIRSLGPRPAPAALQYLLANIGSTIGAELTADVVVTLLAVAGWLLLAWANGKGIPYGRPLAIIACAAYTAVRAAGLAKGDMTYAPALAIASFVVVAVGVATIVLLVMRQSWPYYARHAVAR